MGKQLIKGSDFADTNLDSQVCSHLRPILDVLLSAGNSYDQSTQLQTDKGGGHTLNVSLPIDFPLINRTFQIPTFIDVSVKNHAIVCRRCWCAISTVA